MLSTTDAMGFVTTYEVNALGLNRKTILPGDDTIPAQTVETSYTPTGLPARK